MDLILKPLFFTTELYQVEEMGWRLEGLRYTVLSLRSFPPGGEAEVHVLIAQHVTGVEPVTVSGIREGRLNTKPRGEK